MSLDSKNKKELVVLKSNMLMLLLFVQSGLQILREYFSDLLSLAEILLRSPDPSVSSYACEMYKLSFISFDLYCQQVYYLTGFYLTLGNFVREMHMSGFDSHSKSCAFTCVVQFAPRPGMTRTMQQCE